jgi:hypothetical protein
MLKKKFIFENEEEIEKTDFQTILDLNKKRISPYSVIFDTSDGKMFDDIIEVTRDGIVFTFNGLVQYLGFFFPDMYGEENSDGQYDAQVFEAMYDGRYHWYDEFSDRNYDDWSEGYLADYFKPDHLELIKNLAKYLSPSVYGMIEKNNKGVYQLKGEAENRKVCGFLETIKLSDEITSIYTDAQVQATVDATIQGIKDAYCDCLYEVGIRRYSDKYCFWKYELDWGSAILLFARFGTENDKLLDLLFEGIKKSPNIKHLPECYEMQYNYWDDQKFNEVWEPEIKELLEKKLEDILEDGNLNIEYMKIIAKVSDLGGLGRWLETKDKKYQIQIHSINDETNQISYSIKKKGEWRSKTGKTDIDTLVNMFYNQFLFDPLSEGSHIK